MTFWWSLLLRPSLSTRSGGLFAVWFMDYQAFTNDSLTMMYEGVRGVLAADDALEGFGRRNQISRSRNA